MRRGRWDDDRPGAIAGSDPEDARCFHLAAAEVNNLHKVRGLPRPGPAVTNVPDRLLGPFNRAILEARLAKLEARIQSEDPEFQRSRLRKLSK